MKRIADQMGDLNLNFQSTINDSIGRAFAVQARRGPNELCSSEAGRELYIPHPSLIRKLRNFLGDESATFKTPEQAEAIEFVLAYVGHLLFVAPTAVGKTLAYLLPAAEREHGITCVLLPLSALHADFDRRCKDLKIESSRWTLDNPRPMTKIVYVSPENAQRKQFTDYLFELRNLGHLKHFVVDEVHLVTSHSDFRFCFLALKTLLSCGMFENQLKWTESNLGCTGVPFLLLTATCPPHLRPKLLSMLGIYDDCHVIHAPTDRPEISYRVNLFSTLDEAKRSLVDAVKAKLVNTDSSFRGLVYCRSTEDVEQLAEMIGCKPFHAGRPEEERKVSFMDWVDGKQKFMVCSSLMGCGVDVEGVTTVYHFGTPWSILDFVQESGRAGRSGKRSLSVVYAGKDEREPIVGDEDLYGKVTMRDWVLQTSVCRRTALSSFLDNGHITCTRLKRAALCDVCIAESGKPHPGRLVPFLTPVTPARDIPEARQPPTIPPSSFEYEISRSAPAEDTRLVIFQTQQRFSWLSLIQNNLGR